jgi:adenine-specific DNA methylase
VLESLLDIRTTVSKDLPQDRADAVVALLGLALDKFVDYGSGQCVWDSTRLKVAHSFNLHDYRIRWNPAEFDAAHSLLPWSVEQVCDAYKGIAVLASARTESALFNGAKPSPVCLRRGNVSSLEFLAPKSVQHICVDPPYYDNVMYAECADFFYVWMKRALGGLYPGLFEDELTNKDDEAVANSSRFRGVAKTAKAMAELADADYEHKMAAAFREMGRVLGDGGILTVMFTHKQAQAWNALATSLIGSGFSIRSSWPVHTESEHSLHIAKKNAAQSTILLSCRKREKAGEPVWWDDLKGQVRRAAKEKAQEFEQLGIKGVDLYISTFGPVLSILSENWPVLTSEVDERTGQPKPLRPEVALDIAREEVVALRRKGLLLGRQVQFDPFTDWYLMAWDAFKAEEFPGDEARKLAIALGLDLERQVVAQKKLVAKKGSTVVLQQPDKRRQRHLVDPNLTAFDCWVDAAHTAMLLYKEDGAAACETFLKQAGLLTDGTFKACLQAMINAIPRTKKKDKFVRPEAEVLESLRLAFFDDLVAPPDEAPPQVQVQLDFSFDAEQPAEPGGDVESDGDEEGEESEE